MLFTRRHSTVKAGSESALQVRATALSARTQTLRSYDRAKFRKALGDSPSRSGGVRWWNIRERSSLEAKIWLNDISKRDRIWTLVKKQLYQQQIRYHKNANKRQIPTLKYNLRRRRGF